MHEDDLCTIVDKVQHFMTMHECLCLIVYRCDVIFLGVGSVVEISQHEFECYFSLRRIQWRRMV